MSAEETRRTCVVINGRSFIGQALVLRLLKLGNWIVRITDSTESIQLDHDESNSVISEALSNGRALYYHVDIRHETQLISAIEGSSVVFYLNSTNLDARDIYLCYEIIVQGAKNVVNACRKCNVKRLIYNGSADIVFDGSRDLFDEDESLQIPGKFEDVLCDLKAQAEALVRCANDYDGLLTCALRPSNVFGPRDTHFIPAIVNYAKSGWTKFIIGRGENLSDFTFVENAAHALICAEEALACRVNSVAGKAFFITNLEPVKFWNFVSIIVEGLGYQRPLIKLPAKVALYLLFLVKWMDEKSGHGAQILSVPACKLVHFASRTKTFKCTAAQKHIGYSPVISLDEGIKVTIESFSHLANGSSFTNFNDFSKQSKVDKLLGSGKVADLLLWRDEKKSFTYFLASVLLFYWFFLCERTFVASAAKLLLLVIAMLSIYGILPVKISGFSVPRISLSWFEVSDSAIQATIATMAYFWNRGIHVIYSMAKGEDWGTFFKVAVLLYFLKVILSYSLHIAIGIGLVLGFSSFFVYEQCEKEIDGLADILFRAMKKFMRLVILNLPAPLASFLQN